MTYECINLTHKVNTLFIFMFKVLEFRSSELFCNIFLQLETDKILTIRFLFVLWKRNNYNLVHSSFEFIIVNGRNQEVAYNER